MNMQRTWGRDPMPVIIIIRLHSFSGKNEVLRCCQNTTYVFLNFDTEPNYLVKDSKEKVHTAYMKKTLNVIKFASNMCMYSELRRFPILHNAWSLAINWLCLCTGTGNTQLNNAYRLAMEENHMWVQSIQYLLYSNGLGDIWICPENANAQFHKLFRLRLNDQFIQRWYTFINTSNRFVTLPELLDDFKLPVYINVIKNPSIRLLFTRLRIDINVLSTSRGSKNEKTSVLYVLSKQRMYLILYYDALNLQHKETGSCPMPQYICQITNWALMHHY